MYKIVYKKADFEPWWQFEDSGLYMEKIFYCENEEELIQLIKRFREKFQNEECRENKYYAFWNEDEKEYCDSCDEDVQIYHGLIVEKIK